MRVQIFGASLLAVFLGALPALAQQDPGSEPVPQPAPQEIGQYPATPPPPSQHAALTLPAGTLITVRTTEPLSSDRNVTGDTFTTVLDQPVVAQGLVVSRRGQTVMGRIASAQKAGRVQGVSQLAVELNELVLVDGQQIPIRTQLIQSSAGTSHGRDAEGIGTTTGLGAVIGAAAGGGTGAAIGAAAGAVAGVAGVLSTRGRPTEIYPETPLTFRLLDPVNISTEQSRSAFQPVSRYDYQDQDMRRNPPRYPLVESAPPYYYSPYYYPAWYPPFGYGGYYGYYGFGPSIIIGRGFYGHGYRHR